MITMKRKLTEFVTKGNFPLRNAEVHEGGSRNANCGIFAEEDRKIADRKMKWNEQQRRKDAKGLSLQSSRLRAFAVQSVPFDSCASVICGRAFCCRDAKSAETWVVLALWLRFCHR